MTIIRILTKLWDIEAADIELQVSQRESLQITPVTEIDFKFQAFRH